MNFGKNYRILETSSKPLNILKINLCLEKKSNHKNQIPYYHLHPASHTLCRPCRCSDFSSHLVNFYRNPLLEKKILLCQVTCFACHSRDGSTTFTRTPHLFRHHMQTATPKRAVSTEESSSIPRICTT